MTIIKCPHCDMCFFPVGEQDICPFCGKPLTEQSDKFDLPEGFEFLFKNKMGG